MKQGALMSVSQLKINPNLTSHITSRLATSSVSYIFITSVSNGSQGNDIRNTNEGDGDENVL